MFFPPVFDDRFIKPFQTVAGVYPVFERRLWFPAKRPGRSRSNLRPRPLWGHVKGVIGGLAHQGRYVAWGELRAHVMRSAPPPPMPRGSCVKNLPSAAL